MYAVAGETPGTTDVLGDPASQPGDLSGVCESSGGTGRFQVIAAYILIQSDIGQAAVVAAALRDVPGVSDAAIVAGPYDVIARAQARNIDELGRLVVTRVQALGGVERTITCPVVHLS
jgi:DNA-binding Lrp family transcriptional regulator